MQSGDSTDGRSADRSGRPAGTSPGETAERIPPLAESAADLGQQIKDAAVDAGNEAIDAAKAVADSQKKTGAEFLRTLSKAANAAAREIGEEAPAVADQIRTAADGLEQFGDTFEKKTMSDLMELFTGFARRDPTTLVAGAVLAGFVLTRFVNSSAEPIVKAQSRAGERSGTFADETWDTAEREAPSHG